ncbi:hypothetical protein FB567DRAFT_596995 [Paraphoma chrysanthemicola]|uniref:Transcription factor domain-containing protein n=1 Tax=Paraphoma chrysanthemicola TaxID=798071 RepID=A0A8K0QYE1_9PLEO|nr:hypothetical protein FB567DRAFT_596995 [Paraphoma chrysanthemicola]
MPDMVSEADLAALGLIAASLNMSSGITDLDPHVPITSSTYNESTVLHKGTLLDLPFQKGMQPGMWDSPMTTASTMSALPAASASITQEMTNYLLASEHSFLDNDWLLYPQKSTRHVPLLARHSMQTLLRVMKTWPSILAKGFQTPPILHASQTNPQNILQPMLACTTIAKAWSSQSPQDTDTVRESIILEMRLLFSTYRSYDERNLLSALQAVTMYVIMLMYPGYSQIGVSLIDPAIFLCLQRLVSYVAKTGLVLAEERMNVGLSWESWVHVTSKRTTVFSLYLLHWGYAVYHDLESFACSQLGFMPAPAAKFLWHASTRGEWEVLYQRWLEQWCGEPLTMHELAKVDVGTGLDRRVEMWLEDADELGIMFFGIINATERDNPAYDHGNGVDVLG